MTLATIAPDYSAPHAPWEQRPIPMSKTRLEAFSDGVLAIVITIMVLELVPPEGSTFGDLRPLAPVFLSYALSFANLAIWWNR